MLRSILGALGGYIAIVIVVLAGISVAWAILGAEGAFADGGPHPSAPWIAVNLVCGLLGSLAGGFVARRLGRSTTAVSILIGLILLLGVLTAVTAETQDVERRPLDKPIAELGFFEAGRYARQPTWYNWVVPFIGAAGAWLGGRARSPRPEG